MNCCAVFFFLQGLLDESGLISMLQLLFQCVHPHFVSLSDCFKSTVKHLCHVHFTARQLTNVSTCCTQQSRDWSDMLH